MKIDKTQNPGGMDETGLDEKEEYVSTLVRGKKEDSVIRKPALQCCEFPCESKLPQKHVITDA